MLNVFVKILSLAFDKGEERRNFIETTQSDFYYSRSENVSIASVSFGAIWQSAKSVFRNPLKLGTLYITIVISGIIVSNSSSLGEIGLWLFFIPILTNSYAWAIYISRTQRPFFAILIFVGTSSWIALATIFGQEQSLKCVDCENYLFQNQIHEFGPYSQLVILALLSAFVLLFLYVIIQLFASHSPGSAASLAVTFLIEAAIISIFLSRTDYLETSWSVWVVVITPMPSQLALFLYTLILSWVIASSIILILKSRTLSRRVVAK